MEPTAVDMGRVSGIVFVTGLILGPASNFQVLGESSLHGFSHGIGSSRKHVTAEWSLSCLSSLRVREVALVFEVFNDMPL